MFAPEMEAFRCMARTWRTNRYRDKIKKHILHVTVAEINGIYVCVWQRYAVQFHVSFRVNVKLQNINQVNCIRASASIQNRLVAVAQKILFHFLQLLLLLLLADFDSTFCPTYIG